MRAVVDTNVLVRGEAIVPEERRCVAWFMALSPGSEKFPGIVDLHLAFCYTDHRSDLAIGQTNEPASRFVTAGDVGRGSKSALAAPSRDMALACHQGVGVYRGAYVACVQRDARGLGEVVL
jgi:hypothetical protein